MALLGVKHDYYEVRLLDDAENVDNFYVLARDAEHAAWQGMELSIQHKCKLIDVRVCDER